MSDGSMQSLARALLRYEQQCGELAEEAVEWHRRDRQIELVLLMLPRQEPERHRRLAIGARSPALAGVEVLWSIPRGMSAEVLQVEIARVARDKPVLPL